MTIRTTKTACTTEAKLTTGLVCTEGWALCKVQTRLSSVHLYLRNHSFGVRDQGPEPKLHHRALAIHGNSMFFTAVLFVLGEAFAVAFGCFRASKVLHERILRAVMRAPMSFFDTTPLGRIMNRYFFINY